MPKSGNLLGKVWTAEEDECLLNMMYEVKELKGHYAVIAKKQLARSLQRSEKATTLRWMRLLIRHQTRIEHERIKRGLTVAKQRDTHKINLQQENKDFQSAIETFSGRIDILGADNNRNFAMTLVNQMLCQPKCRLTIITDDRISFDIVDEAIEQDERNLVTV